MTNLHVFLTVLQTLIHAQLNLVQTMEPVSILLVEVLDVPALPDGLENAVTFVSSTSLCPRISRLQERCRNNNTTFSRLVTLASINVLNTKLWEKFFS